MKGDPIAVRIATLAIEARSVRPYALADLKGILSEHNQSYLGPTSMVSHDICPARKRERATTLLPQPSSVGLVIALPQASAFI